MHVVAGMSILNQTARIDVFCPEKPRIRSGGKSWEMAPSGLSTAAACRFRQLQTAAEKVNL